MSGKFVTIEGCEGVGKSTLLVGLRAAFAARGIDAVFTREPGGTPAAERIRSVILDPECALTPYSELLLYAAARAQHTEEKIIPALRAGKIVVCDRYSDSTMAYQGYARGTDKSVVAALNAIAERGVNIDLTIFLDLDPASGFVRKGGADRRDRMESESAEFHRRVYDGFRAIAAENARVAAVDASKSAGDVLDRTLEIMSERGII